MPSPVYWLKKAFWWNMAVKCSEMCLNSFWMAMLLPVKVTDIFRTQGRTLQIAVLTLLWILCTK